MPTLIWILAAGLAIVSALPLIGGLMVHSVVFGPDEPGADSKPEATTGSTPPPGRCPPPAGGGGSAAPRSHGREPAGEIFTIHDDGDGVLRLAGELDIASAPDLLRRLAEPPGVRELRLRDVTFMDSTGLHALLAAARACDPAHRLILRDPSPAVRRVVDITGVAGLFRIEPPTAP
jgi:anti-anti-sigma factor